MKMNWFVYKFIYHLDRGSTPDLQAKMQELFDSIRKTPQNRVQSIMFHLPVCTLDAVEQLSINNKQ